MRELPTPPSLPRKIDHEKPYEDAPIRGITPNKVEHSNENPIDAEETKIELLVRKAARRQLDHLGSKRVQRRLLAEKCVVLRVAEAEGKQRGEV